MGAVKPSAQIQRRRKRIPAEAVRERMFDAARDLVRLRGVTISLEELSMDEVVAKAGVPRSSAYRIWPYKGDFVNDLLLHFAGPRPDWMAFSAFDEETLIAAAEVFVERWDELETLEGRLAAVDEAIRVAVQQNFVAIAASPDWQVYAALSATARGNTNDESRAELVTALEDADLIFVRAMAAFYELVGRAAGLRPVDGMSYEQLALAGAAVVEGLAIRKVLLDAKGADDSPMRSLLVEELPAPRGSAQAPWSLVARAYRGIFLELLEPVSEWTPDDATYEAVKHVATNGPNSKLKNRSLKLDLAARRWDRVPRRAIGGVCERGAKAMDNLPPNIPGQPGVPPYSQVQGLTPQQIAEMQGNVQDLYSSVLQPFQRRDQIRQEIDKPWLPTTGQQ